jgi:cytoskeleton protein RodZ
MTETSNNNNTNTIHTPGQILRSQREKLDLSIQEIAKRIHLDIRIIESIENDSHEGMPTATYVRGYLRSYAKMVGADADKIITLYDSDSPPAPPEILPEVKPPTQVSSSDKPVKAFTYLITLGLVLLLLIWYQSNFVVDTSTNDEQVLNKTGTRINGVDITYKIINHPDSWQSPESNLEEGFEIEPTAPKSSNQIDALELQTDSGEQAIGIISIEGIDNDSLTSATGHGPDTIDLKLTRDSWIEIYDANNKRLFHDLGLGGEQHSINGTAPFKVLLGFSNGVTVEFNGKPFDTEPFSNNGIARFTLSKQ